MAEENDIVIRKGAWYSYKGDNIGQGRDNTIKYLEENSEVATEIEQLLWDKLNAEKAAALGISNGNGASSTKAKTEEE